MALDTTAIPGTLPMSALARSGSNSRTDQMILKCLGLRADVHACRGSPRNSSSVSIEDPAAPRPGDGVEEVLPNSLSNP